jgi:circadian clock protein KaiC
MSGYLLASKRWMKCAVVGSSKIRLFWRRATGTGKTMLVSKFLENACIKGDRAILFAYEESRAQLSRNASSWGIEFEDLERQGLLKIICTYPESAGLEDHLQIIKSQISEFKPSRIAIDSLSALARG